RSASAAAPGPGPLSESLLRQLELGVARRMESLLPGDHRSALLGSGTELAQVRPYRPGEDDVRLIDWNVTARMAEPHVRVQLAERLLVTWVLLDVSPSMGFGTADRRKADVAEGAALALAYAATRRGNRLGVVTFGDGDVRALPPRQGRAGMLSLLLALRGEADEGTVGPTSLGRVLGRTARLARQHALVAIVSDFRGPRDWRAALSVPEENATVVLAIDTSRSMAARDVRPTRLDAARRAVDAFLKELPAKYRVGVVAFASSARVVAPATHNRFFVRRAIQELRPGEGTALGDAIA